MPRNIAVGGRFLIPTSHLSSLGWDRALQLMATAFLLHNRPVRMASWAEALVLQMGKLRLREGTCPGLYPEVFPPHPTPQSKVQRGYRPKRTGEEKWWVLGAPKICPLSLKQGRLGSPVWARPVGVQAVEALCSPREL